MHKQNSLALSRRIAGIDDLKHVNKDIRTDKSVFSEEYFMWRLKMDTKIWIKRREGVER